jgi:hypothetical protein
MMVYFADTFCSSYLCNRPCEVNNLILFKNKQTSLPQMEFLTTFQLLMIYPGLFQNFVALRQITFYIKYQIIKILSMFSSTNVISDNYLLIYINNMIPDIAY